jgi:hypothetical protein
MALTRSGFAFANYGKGFGSEKAEPIDAAADSSFLGKLASAKRVAFRRGVWFRVLNRLERGVVDLTMRYVDEVKSSKLARVLTAIMEKLVQATESIIESLVRTVGRELAKKASDVAVGWGYSSAWAWSCDSGFARYLAVNTGGGASFGGN